MTDACERAIVAHRDRYGRDPDVLVRAPGRINLMGDHTDYNEGFVLPMAIEPALWLALHETPDRVVLHAEAEAEPADLPVDGDVERASGWVRYVRAVLDVLSATGARPRGVSGTLASDIPVGAGLSSSAALELAVLRAVDPRGDGRPVEEVARLAQRAENEGVGMQCGIMDQLACAGGREGAALLLDCRDLTVVHTPLPPQLAVVVMDTSTRRTLVGSAYNDRRRQCEAAAAVLGVPALRDADLDDVATLSDPLLRRRARHVVTESRRAVDMAAALSAGDVDTVGGLMAASHASLRDDFEVSGLELDEMVDIATAQPGCRGARMTGGGFAGCAVAIVDRAHLTDFVRAVAGTYAARTRREAHLLVTGAADGAGHVARHPMA